jgi:hypothetical protein
MESTILVVNLSYALFKEVISMNIKKMPELSLCGDIGDRKVVFENHTALKAVRENDLIEVGGEKMRVEQVRRNQPKVAVVLEDGRQIRMNQGQISVGSESVDIVLRLDTEQMPDRIFNELREKENIVTIYILVRFVPPFPAGKKPEAKFTHSDKACKEYIEVYSRQGYYFVWFNIDGNKGGYYESKDELTDDILREIENRNMDFDLRYDEIDLLDDPELCSKLVLDAI